MSFQVYLHRAKQSILFNLNLNVFSASVVSPLSHFELSSCEAEFIAHLCMYIRVCVATHTWELVSIHTRVSSSQLEITFHFSFSVFKVTRSCFYCP